MSWSVARKCSRRYSSKDIHKYLCCIFYFSLQNSSFVAFFVFGNSIKLCLHWIEHSNDKFWIRTLRKGCLGFAESQCRNPQNIQLVLCPQLQHKTYSHFMFVHLSKQFWLDRNSKLARYSNNLILKTRLSFLLCAAAIVKMVYCKNFYSPWFRGVVVSRRRPKRMRVVQKWGRSGGACWISHVNGILRVVC